MASWPQGALAGLLQRLPSLTSLGQIDCPWAQYDPVEWASGVSTRLQALHLYVNSPGAAVQLGQVNWACEAGGASMHACALERISYGLATRVPSLRRLFIDY